MIHKINIDWERVQIWAKRHHTKNKFLKKRLKFSPFYVPNSIIYNKCSEKFNLVPLSILKHCFCYWTPIIYLRVLSPRKTDRMSFPKLAAFTGSCLKSLFLNFWRKICICSPNLKGQSHENFLHPVFSSISSFWSH